MKLANKLKQLRQECGREVTQVEIANAINLSMQYISLIELGKAVPSARIVKRFADFYGVSHGTLLDLARRDKLANEERKIMREYELA